MCEGYPGQNGRARENDILTCSAAFWSNPRAQMRSTALCSSGVRSTSQSDFSFLAVSGRTEDVEVKGGL